MIFVSKSPPSPQKLNGPPLNSMSSFLYRWAFGVVLWEIETGGKTSRKFTYSLCLSTLSTNVIQYVQASCAKKMQS